MKPIVPAVFWGGAFTALQAAQGSRLTPQMFAANAGFIYLYNALQCPMEAIQGQPSLLHNACAAGALGAFLVQSGQAGIPFLDTSYLYRNRNVTPAMTAFAVYACIGVVLGGLGGKSF